LQLNGTFGLGMKTFEISLFGFVMQPDYISQEDEWLERIGSLECT
jgi:hypothetical protein